MFNSYRIQIFLLIATIGVGLYTLLTIYNSDEPIISIITENGLIINTTDNKPYTGQVIDTVANQVIRFEVKEGIKNGQFNISFLNGKKAVTGNVVNNKNEGKWSYYYETGELESEGYFSKDVVVGEWVWYFPNGNKMEEGKYLKGKREGLWKLYNEDGTMKSSMYFQDGKVVSSSEKKSLVAS